MYNTCRNEQTNTGKKTSFQVCHAYEIIGKRTHKFKENHLQLHKQRLIRGFKEIVGYLHIFANYAEVLCFHIK